MKEMNGKLKYFLNVFAIIINITFSVIGGATVGRYVSTALPEPLAIGAGVAFIIFGALLFQCLLDDYRKEKKKWVKNMS